MSIHCIFGERKNITMTVIFFRLICENSKLLVIKKTSVVCYNLKLSQIVTPQGCFKQMSKHFQITSLYDCICRIEVIFLIM